MSSEKRFKRLAEEVTKRRREREQKEIDERRRIKKSELIKIHVPLIDKVCRHFSKGIDWRYSGYKERDIILGIQTFEFYPRFSVYHYYAGDSSRIHRFLVTLDPEKVRVHYDEGAAQTPKYSREMPINELSERKLAQTFEDLYKMVYNL